MPAPGAAEVSPLCIGFFTYQKQGLKVVEKIFQNFYQNRDPVMIVRISCTSYFQNAQQILCCSHSNQMVTVFGRMHDIQD